MPLVYASSALRLMNSNIAKAAIHENPYPQTLYAHKIDTSSLENPGIWIIWNGVPTPTVKILRHCSPASAALQRNRQLPAYPRRRYDGGRRPTSTAGGLGSCSPLRRHSSRIINAASKSRRRYVTVSGAGQLVLQGNFRPGQKSPQSNRKTSKTQFLCLFRQARISRYNRERLPATYRL